MPLPHFRPRFLHTLRLIPLFAGLAALAAAQNAQDPTPPSAFALKPEASKDIACGKITAVQSEIGTEPERYVLENLTILQPVHLIVRTKKAGENLKVQLSKHIWDQVEQEGSTADTGSAVFKFRTEGDMKIKVTSDDGQSHIYQIICWVGDAEKPSLKSPFVSMAAFKKNAPAGSGGFAASPVLWAIVGLLGAIVVLLAIIALKKKRA